MTTLKWSSLAGLCILLCQCAGSSGSGYFGPANMGGPTAEERQIQISNEPTGDFFYGRRYFVEKTRFWGFLRKPGQAATSSKLVLFKEDRKHQPDRLPENGSPGYNFDNNYEYRIKGYYTGEEGYDPNSNQFLPVFMLTDYELVDRNPGWLFSPDDHYDRYRVTLYP